MMTTRPKFKIASIFVFACLLFAINARAQTQAYADLELIVAFPQNNQVIPFGDTVRLSFFIINHGPDDIVGDTLMIRNEDEPMFGSGFIGDIPVGDTGMVPNGPLYWMAAGQTSNDTFNACYYFPHPVSFSNRVADTNAFNDTACISFILLGDTTTGIANSMVQKTIQLFPNPAKGWVQIGMNTSDYHKLQLSVTDIYGRVVFSQEYGMKSLLKENNIQFDATGFSPGVYFVRLRADDKTFMSKLVVR